MRERWYAGMKKAAELHRDRYEKRQVPIGIEPMHDGFADRFLTAWIWHRVAL